MVMQIRRTIAGGPPVGLADGQLSVELLNPNPRLWVGCPTSVSANRRLLISDGSGGGSGITLPLAITQGGTGATTAAAARANLGITDGGGGLPITGGTITGDLTVTGNVHVGSPVAVTIDGNTGFAHLNGLDLHGPATINADNVPLQLVSATNADCKLGFSGPQTWTVGVEGYTSPPGEFWIWTSGVGGAAPIAPIQIGTSGGVRINGDNLPLQLFSAATADCKIGFNGAAQWTIGVEGYVAGEIGWFWIYNVTTAAAPLRIDTSGNVLLTSDNQPLQLFSNTNADCKIGFNGPAGWTIGVEGYVAAQAGHFLIYSVDAGAVMLRLDPGGWLYAGQSFVAQADNLYECGATGFAWSQVHAYNYITESDPRHKRDIEDAPVGALEAVRKLAVKRYHLDNDADDAPLHHGFLSTDVHTAMPDFGGWHKSQKEHGLEGISYNQLTAVLWQAVQELSAEIAELKGARK